MDWTLCGDAADGIDLPTGTHHLDARATGPFRPTELVLTRDSPTTTVTPNQALLQDADLISLPQRDGTTVLVLAHNYNAGWTAELSSGAALTPVRLNGWQQGFVVPPGATDQVRATFAPQNTYVAGLAAGFLTLFALAITALWRRDRRGGVPKPRRSTWLAPAVFALAAVVSAGFVGLLALLWGLASGRVLGSAKHERALGVLLPGLLMVAIVALSPWGHGAAALDSWVAQVLAWSVAGAICCAGAVAPAAGRRPSAMMGRST